MFVRIRATREKDKLLFIGCADMTVGVENLFRSDCDQQTSCCGDVERSWRGLSPPPPPVVSGLVTVVILELIR